MDTILTGLYNNTISNLTINRFGLQKAASSGRPPLPGQPAEQHSRSNPQPLIQTVTQKGTVIQHKLDDILDSTYDAAYYNAIATGDVPAVTSAEVTGLDDDEEEERKDQVTVPAFLDDLKTPPIPQSPLPYEATTNTGDKTTTSPLGNSYLYQVLCRIVQSPAYYSLVDLNLTYNQLTRTDGELLSSALRTNTSLLSLNLSYNRLGVDGCYTLMNAMKVNTKLQSLHIAGNNILDEGGLCIGEMLQVNKTLQNLDVSVGGIYTRGCQAIFSALEVNQKLKTLSIAKNAVLQQGAAALSKALAANRSLHKLDLSSTLLYTEGCDVLAEGLRQNSTLQELYMADNEIRGDGCKSLAVALKEHASLKHLSIRDNLIDSNGCKYLANSLSSKKCILTSLYICDNPLGSKGAEYIGKSLLTNVHLNCLRIAHSDIKESAGVRAIAKALKHNTTLTELDFSWNRCGTDEAAMKSVATMLTVNRALRALDFSHNKLVEEGSKLLSDALMKNTTLQRLDLSSNRISIKGLEDLAAGVHSNHSLLHIKYEQSAIQQLVQGQPPVSVVPSSATADIMIVNAIHRNTTRYQSHVRHTVMSMFNKSNAAHSSMGLVFARSPIGDPLVMNVVFDILFGVNHQQLQRQHQVRLQEAKHRRRSSSTENSATMQAMADEHGIIPEAAAPIVA